MEAADEYEQLLVLALQSDDGWRFDARQSLGRPRHGGDLDADIAHHARALALADELGQPVDQARA